MPKKCVFGCPPSKDQAQHVFPNYKRFPERFRTWVEIAGGNLDNPSNYELYQRSIVCDIHFTEKDKNRNRRLSASAIPSLHLGDKGEPKVYEQEMKAANPNRSESNAEEKAAHVGSNDPFQCPVKHHDDTKITITQFHIDNALQEICDEGADRKSRKKRSSDHQLKTPKRKYMYKTSTRSRQIEHLKPISSLPKTGIVRLPPETHANEESCDVIEEDDSAEVPVVEPGVLFSWQQPSAVVPCDDDEAGSSNNECTQPELEVESTENTTLGGYRCNECSDSIVGFRYTCVQCADYDICGSCEARGAHPLHYVLRVPGQRPHGEVTQVLHQIRRLLLADAVIDLSPGDIVEIKKESSDVEDPIAGDFSFEQHDPITVESFIRLEDDPTVISFCDEDDLIIKPLPRDKDDPITKHLSCDEDEDPLTGNLSSEQEDPITKHLPCDKDDPITKHLSCDEDEDPLTGNLSSEQEDPITKHLPCDKDDPITKHLSCDEDEDPLTGNLSSEQEDPITKHLPCDKDDPITKHLSCDEDEDPLTGNLSCDQEDPITEHLPCDKDDPITKHLSCDEDEDPLTGNLSSEQEDPITEHLPCDKEDPKTKHLSCDEDDDPLTENLSCDQEDPITKHLPCDKDNPITRELSCDEDEPMTKQLSCDEDEPMTKQLSCDEDDPMEVVSFESEADNSKAKESCDKDDQMSIQSSCIENDPEGHDQEEDDTVAEQTFEEDDPITVQSFKEEGPITVQSFKEDDSITVQSCDDAHPIVSHPSCGEDNSMAFELSCPNPQKSMPVLKRTGSSNPEPVKLSRAADFRSDDDWTSKHASSVPLKRLTIIIPRLPNTERLPVTSRTKQYTTQRVRRSMHRSIDTTKLPDHLRKKRIHVKRAAVPKVQSSREAVVRVKRLSAAEIKAALHKS